MDSANRAAVVVARRQRLPFGGDRLVEQLLGPRDGPVELTAPHGLTPHPPGPGQQVVQAPPAVRAAAQQVAQRLPEAAAREHLGADLVDGGPHVVRRRRAGRARPAIRRTG